MFYPPGLPQARKLAFAAHQFPAVELNGSLYSLQRPCSYARWAADTPHGFVFAVKAPGYITHILRLRNARAAVAKFQGWVLANTAGRWPQVTDVTADFVYLRLHGAQDLYFSRCTGAQLAAWPQRIRVWATGGTPTDLQRLSQGDLPARPARNVFCFFDNTEKIHAPTNTLELAHRFGLGQRLQISA